MNEVSPEVQKDFRDAIKAYQESSSVLFVAQQKLFRASRRVMEATCPTDDGNLWSATKSAEAMEAMRQLGNCHREVADKIFAQADALSRVSELTTSLVGAA